MSHSFASAICLSSCQFLNISPPSKMPMRQVGQLEPCCSSHICTSALFGSRLVRAVHCKGQTLLVKTGGGRKQTNKMRGESGSNLLPNWSSDCHQSSLLINCSQMFLLLITTIALVAKNGGAMAQSTGKCYSFSPGLTILGADYRRDFGLSRRECAEMCKSDMCCMAFEWRRVGGQCTLKSRSLNGTVTATAQKDEKMEQNDKDNSNNNNNNDNSDDEEDATFFALCLDYGDSDRDRFWDHELSGPVVASAEAIERGKCAELCGDFTGPIAAAKRYRRSEEKQAKAKRTQSEKKRKNGAAVIYSWRSHNPSDVETPLGECQCISVLQHIRISFGSFAGFLI